MSIVKLQLITFSAPVTKMVLRQPDGHSLKPHGGLSRPPIDDHGQLMLDILISLNLIQLPIG